ncbi:uvrD/REP helicase N-terminal domain protein [Mycobacterium kansasii]|uniref:DNA 3'-5' helicase n=1 Tax=Mycobacterium kansasii TaxID=1768 RepID=A0A1V3XML0_MYCKA|nr:uvrD/REP helicase N-terminal domain protein [Mycobacterium kansasii]
MHATDAKSETDQLLDGLNPQQRQAVLHEGAPLLIVAGAGSGKTAVLTRRIAYLIAARGVAVGQILAITFTNKAAAEMRERVVRLVGARARYMWVSTFHSTCVRILRNQASLIEGLNSNFSIYDADDSRRLLQMIGRDMGLDIKRYSPRLLANAISNLKNELIDPHRALAHLTDDSDDLARTVASVYAEYQRRLRAANALDFDDLIGETVAVLQTFPDIAQYYRRRFRHVLVDEYQDTNHAQYVLVRELVGRDTEDDVPPAELCVVGDADQSIYAFRGATIRNIEDFERDYPDATTILLEQNYRSTQNILSAANSVIARNAGRREKRLWTDAGEGELIVGYVADNEHDEARFVAEEIDALAERGEITYNDVAVFYRTNNSSRSLEEVFIRAGIPYKVVGACAFTSARRSATSSPTCVCWTIPVTRSACGAFSTRHGAASAIAPRRAWPSTPRTPAPASQTRYKPRPRARCRCSTPARRRRSRALWRSSTACGAASMTTSVSWSRRCWNVPDTVGSWNRPPTPRSWRGWTTSTNSSASHTNSAPTRRIPLRWNRTTKTCRTPACWRRFWNECR